MTTWKPPHKTAQQRRTERPKRIRQIDSAALAPSVSLPPNRCECGHMALAHTTADGIPCGVPGCDCTKFVREST